MTIVTQTTYRCRCGKKNKMPEEGATHNCGCGRSATVRYGKVSVTEKPRRTYTMRDVKGH